ncbi:hypothetical protein MBANPS3_005798 [Mucor bainieri]
MPRRLRHTYPIEQPVLKIVGRKSTKAASKRGAIQAFKSWCRFTVEKTCRDKPMRKIKKKVVSKRPVPQCLKTQPNPVDSLRYEFACKKLTLSQSLRSNRNKKKQQQQKGDRHQIQFGHYLIDTWFASPYPPEVYTQSKFFVCEFCFVSIKTAAMAKRHKEKCCMKCPPGNEIYRQGNISIFEVDGLKNKMYCLNLCLLTKLFLDHKTLFYDVEPFLFYIMTETDQDGCHFVGYFSKEKRSVMNYNVSCILILPTHQRKGYGQYLIDFSYLLTRRESKVGTPEKPLSALGSLGYQRYWDYTVLKHFSSGNYEQCQSIDGISIETGMTPDDIIAALQRNNLLRLNDGRYELHINQSDIDKELAKIESKKQLHIDPTKLMWTPPNYSHVYMDTITAIQPEIAFDLAKHDFDVAIRQETNHDSTQKKTKPLQDTDVKLRALRNTDTKFKALQDTHTKFEALQRTVFANYLMKRFSNKVDWKKVVWATSFRVKDTKLWACMYHDGVAGIRELNFEWDSGDFDPPNYKTEAYTKVLKSEVNKVFTQHNQDKQEAILQTDPNCTDGAGYMWIHNKKKPLGGCIFGWPSKSMDLHPMTPIIQQFKETLPDLEGLEKAAKTEAIKATWEAMSSREITKSIDQMPHRLNAVLENQGQAIDDNYYTYCLDSGEYQEYSKKSTKYEKGGFISVWTPPTANA